MQLAKSSTGNLNINLYGLTWFEDSPDVGMPECKCSLCLDMIKEDEFPIRFWSENRKKEIRLHDKCFKKRLIQINNDVIEKSELI